MITDPIGDLFTRIKNASKVGKREIIIPYSKMKEEIVAVLEKEGYVADVKKSQNNLIFTLVYKRKQPLISGIKSISRPGLHIYKKKNSLPNPLRGAGISIISTSKGIMSGIEAGKKNLGGEVLAEIW